MFLAQGYVTYCIEKKEESQSTPSEELIIVLLEKECNKRKPSQGL